MNGKFRFKMIKIYYNNRFEAVAFMFIDVKATFALYRLDTSYCLCPTAGSR